MELEKIEIPNNPYFTFVIDMLDVALQLRINDVPIFTDKEGGEASIETSMNEYLLQGSNQIQLTVNAIEGEEEFRSHAECNVSLYVRDKNMEANSRQPLWIIKAYPAELSVMDVNVLKPESRSSQCSHVYFVDEQFPDSITVSSTVEIDYPFPQWAWIKGEFIDDNEENFKSLIEQYRDIHIHLQNKDLDVLKTYTQKKAEEFSIAYHMPAYEDGERLVGLASEAMKNTQTLHPFWEKGMKLDVYANGRVARIVDDDEDGPILFLIGEGNAANVLKLAFYKDEKKGWILIR